MLSIIIKELAKEYGWSQERIVQLFVKFAERQGQKYQKEIVSYLVRAGKNEKEENCPNRVGG